MLLPLTHLPTSSLPPKSLTDQSLSPFFSFPKTHLSQIPKPPKFTIRSSTSDTQILAPKSAIQRIAEKLRSLGFTENNQKAQPQPAINSAGEIFVPLPEKLPKYRVGHTLDSSWSTPENPVPEPGTGRAISRFHELRREVKEQRKLEKKESKGKKDDRVPTLAELSLAEDELKRLRTVGIGLKKKLKVGKAGITEGIVNGIHENWRRSEVVKIVCEDLCRMNMKRTHDLLERKTGGLVVWRSGSKIVLYRGANYTYPYFLSDKVHEDLVNDTSCNKLPDAHIDDGEEMSRSSSRNEVKSSSIPSPTNERARPSLVQGVGLPNRYRFQLPGEAQLAEEADRLLEGLGPRFTDWWGYEPLPVDADLLPAIVPGYRRPFRLLPYGVQPKLTDDEMTILRRLGRPLPCHFALGRNRNLQGLAASIVKLWEKCEIAKIAVKRGVQNTNSEMMAEELKRLTGGTLIARDREFIVLYRGKDFLPPAVSSAIEERRKHGIHTEKKFSTSATTALELDPRTGPEYNHDRTNDHKIGVPCEKRKLKSTEAAVNRTSIKLSMALEKRAKAEKLLAELEKAETPQQPEIDKEGITEEERYMLRKVGLRMKPFLLLGRRGVFDGTIENMHLHWKYRELVKIIANEKSIAAVHQVAHTLEAESGGVLVAVERVNKGYAIIVYRGKNYSRPASLRPQTLLSKRQAMKRSIEAQRRESLKLHVLRLDKNIDELKLLLGKDREADNMHFLNEAGNQLVAEEVNIVQSEEFLRSDAELKYDSLSHSVEPAFHEENVEARDEHGAHATPMNLNDGMAAVVNGQLATQQDRLTSFSSTCDEDETGKVEPGSSNETDANLFKDVNGEVGARDKQEGHATPRNLYHGMGAMVKILATQQDKVISFSSTCDEDETGKEEPGSSNEPVTNETHAILFKDINAEARAFVSTPFPEDVMSNGLGNSPFVDQHRVSDNEVMDSSGRSCNSESELSVPIMVRKNLNELPSRAEHLSNKERLLLRKQALKMKKRPVLAVGRNNIVTGVAKAIKAHFEKHPLAIVNVKGRAKGTSVREVVFKLEQATGAVLVSQEPSKVILYRGWGAGDNPGHRDKKNASNMGRKVATKGAVSPELLAAIRLECGLQCHKKEDGSA